MTKNFVAALFLTLASCGLLRAETIRVWIASAVIPAHETFRFGVDDHLINVSSPGLFYFDEENSLFDKLTNGIEDQVTFADFVVQENYFLGDVVKDPFPAFCSYPEYFDSSTIDLYGWTIQSIDIHAIPRANEMMYYNVSLYAHLPEPTTFLIIVHAGCLLLTFRLAR